MSPGSSAASRGEEGFEVVVELAVPLYWATREGIHIFPDPNRITEVSPGPANQPLLSLFSACFGPGSGS